MNVCMEALENSSVHESMYGTAREQQGSMNIITPPHPTISHQTFQKRTKRWFGFQPIGHRHKHERKHLPNRLAIYTTYNVSMNALSKGGGKFDIP